MERPPGPSPLTSPGVSWSSIASMNVSKRNKTNTLEVRLEKDEGTSCKLKVEEIERLLRRLNIQANQFTSVQACPERRNVVFITLVNGVDIKRFINPSNESFILKPGIRTTVIKEVNRREVNVQVFGLHPDTKDEAVIRYLNAHGKVNTKLPVTYSTYPGAPGSSLLAGKRNGNRSYAMEVNKNIGSVHIIDGEKVSIKYQGQIKTCNKCHQQSNACPGKGLAKDCSADRILLSQHMATYWKQINYQPDTMEMNDVDIEEEDEDRVSKVDEIQTEPALFSTDTNMIERYSGVVIKGVKKGSDLQDITDTLKEAGLPFSYEKEDLQVYEKHNKLTIYIHDLQPETCVELVNNLHGQEKMGSKLSLYSLVEDTPTKPTEETPKAASTSSESLNTTSTTPTRPDPMLGKETSSSKPSKFWADEIEEFDFHEDSSEDNTGETRETFKRKAVTSPESNIPGLAISKKEKKKFKNLINKSN